MGHPGDFPGNARFQLLRRLGAGGMGVVHEALDLEQGTRVAVKSLRELTPRSLARFKHEFRAMQDVRHPNLVSLGELFEERGWWFFTMELIDGVDFLDWVRPGSEPAGDPEAFDEPVSIDTRDTIDGAAAPRRRLGKLDEGRLRAALGQLAAALGALHAAGKVHRDVKPGNLKVTAAGRLVLLDFGLVADDDEPSGDSNEPALVGTTAYMAPEQATSAKVGPEADWYGVGVTLYEALTGRVPFAGAPLRVLMDKQAREAPLASSTAPGPVPADLDALCAKLLRFDRQRRAGAREVLAVVAPRAATGPGALLAAAEARAASASQPSLSQPGAAPFVGRAAELAELGAALSDSRRGALVVVVRGDSGMGKTSLVRQFARARAADTAELVILAGRCHEREAVPYKAFDGAIDDLTRHLKRLSELDAAVHLGPEGGLVARVFPALGRLAAVRRSAATLGEIPDPQELRARAFAALRELLARLAARAPLVLTIDDAQWADADSLALLHELLRPPDAPAMLTIVTTRPASAALDQTLAGLGEVRELALGGLTPGDGAELARLVAQRLAAPATLAAAELAREAAGHPLFLQELVQHVAAHGAQGGAPVRLDDVLGARLDALEPAARQLLDVICLAGAPLLPRVAFAASGLEPAEAARQLAVLRVAGFARTSLQRGRESVEPYHDRVRTAVLARLAGGVELHAAIAEALESAGAGEDDPHLLLLHLEAAGELRRAAGHAERAAERATAALAFERAGELLRAALDLGAPVGGERRRLLAALAENLAAAGRCREAAECWRELAADAGTPTVRLEFRRRSAEQLLVSGHVDEGLSEIRTVFAEVGLRFPETPGQVIRTVLRHRLALRLRGLRWKEQDPANISARDHEQLEFHKTVGVGLAVVDNARAAAFSARGLRIALEAGQKLHVARFMAIEVGFIAARGVKARGAAERLLTEVRRIAGDGEDPYLTSIALVAAANLDYLTGRFAAALPRYREGVALLRDRTTGTTWELNGTRTFLLHAARYLGACRELSERFDEYLRDAARRGDRYSSTTMARASNLVWLLRDEPARAARELAERTWSPPDMGFLHLQHWYELRAQVELALYQGAAAGQLEALAPRFQAVRRSLLGRVQTVRTELTWLEGRIALVGGRLGDATRAAKALRKEGAGYARVWAGLLDAAVARRSKAEGAAAAYRLVAGAARDADLALVAAVADARVGELGGGEGGARAAAWFAKEGVRKPERIVAVYDPP